MLIKILEKLFLLIVLSAIGFSSFFAANALMGKGFEYLLPGNGVFSEIPIRIDALSGWMMLIINFTVLTGTLYGLNYLKSYKDKPANYILHLFLIIIFHVSMLSVCVVQNFLAFLMVWEIMAISSFLLVILEHWKSETLKAGINYLIQSHVGVIFMTIGFIWVIAQTGSYDFKALGTFSQQVPMQLGITLFILLFIGFGFKAGFVPFHTWLPYAHPAAPSHISGMMSGIIIKLGIYGILRSLLLIKSDYLIIGEIILVVSVISGLYGVMLAIVQHNLKRLLAYHSIENIGIIGIGIGIGTIGLGLKNDFLAITGFAGGLLHILNHSLFKSLLFYGAGSIYKQTHTLNVEKLGGLIKRMPQTAAMFLIAALAICGLPPFNGFISEFLIYSGLFAGLKTNSFAFSLFLLTAIVSLVLIGGLAILCFTKAFGVVFLGTERHKFEHEPHEVPKAMIFPKYLVAALIIAIGLFPQVFLKIMEAPLALFVPSVRTTGAYIYANQASLLSNIGLTGFIIAAISFLIFGIRKMVEKKKPVAVSPTWGCGYVAPNPRMQYTASSFVKSYSNLIKPILSINRSEIMIDSIFPGRLEYESSTYDKAEHYLIDKNLKFMKKVLYKFNIFQNGKTQFYILYGLIFILLIIIMSYGEYFGKMLTGFLGLFKN